MGLKCFASHLRDCNILLRIDNTTAITYINRMGGIRFQKLNDLARDLWTWCEKRNIFVFASYISSKENVEADLESRRLEPETEYELSDSIFSEISHELGEPKIDLFASRINKKCKKYISWLPDPDSVAVDSFTIFWKKLRFYAFPPFSIILKVLRKIIDDKATGIVVVPDWPTQPWYPLYHSLLISKPLIFKPNKKMLFSSSRPHHPLWQNLSLVAGILSGNHTN